MTTKEILIAARAKIEKPENWCQGCFSKDHQWCAVGALVDIAGYGDGCAAAMKVLAVAVDGMNVVVYNDSHTHAEVLAKFDEAIAAA